MDDFTVLDVREAGFFESYGFDTLEEAETFFSQLATLALKCNHIRTVSLFNKGVRMRQASFEVKR